MVIAIALCSLVSTPAWVTELKAKTEPMLIAKAKPLTVARITGVIRSLGFAPYNCHVGKITGTRGDYFAGVNRDIDACTLWIKPSGVVSVVEFDADKKHYLASYTQQAHVIDGILLLGGLSHWLSNYAGFGFKTFAKQNGQWKRTSSAVTTHQFVDWAKPAGAGYFDVRTRAYPTNFIAGHVGALLSVRERFKLENGLIKRVEGRLMDTPFNTLDELVGAIAHKRADTVKRLVPSAALRKRLPGLFRRVGDELIVGVPNHRFDVDGRVFILGPRDRDGALWFHFKRRHGHWVVSKIDWSSK